MGPAISKVAPELEVRRTYPAKKEAVYRAWTEKTALSKWFAPSDEYTTIVHALDVRVGGSYRLEMKHTSGKSHILTGTYREIVPNEKVSFTWRWDDKSMEDTLVTVDIREKGELTEVILTHRLFENEATRDDHKKGWTGCLERLAAKIENIES
jgi:uncharacterized protein YndB with AHSA1/START domain